MSVTIWTIDELRKMVALSDEVYITAKKLEEKHGRKIYEGLMTTLDLKGSSEAASKYLEIQYRSATPLVLIQDETWYVNKDLLTYILKSIDSASPVNEIIKEGEVNPSKYIGRVRLKLGGAWGEIIAFYILNDPLPKMTNIFYLLHMATYVTTFTTVTIPEIYTGSEEFLKLISNVDDKRGALEFLTRLLRRRYIPEDQYAKALESVNKRHDLTFSNLREELEKREARLIISEYLTQGIPGLIAKLSSIVEQYKDSPIPRESISSIVGEIYIITSSLREVLSEYDKALKVLNDLLTTSGKTITPDRISKIIEELSKML
ncbi:MAG: hypothetical protein QXW87_01515 [Desulfurococcaceae archaeon]|uniref:Uncharacterized protein n=1 Tax=Staphylothermus marinus TaxID=2280 RepID=A0A7C4H9C5_STAMA